MQLFDLADLDGQGDGRTPRNASTELLPHDGSALLWRRWLDTATADATFAALMDEVPLEHRSIRVGGREVAQPRLDAWIGDPGTSYRYSGVTVTPRPWTPTTASLQERLAAHCGTRFNSVLVNLYRDGSDSMGDHADDEPELGATPTIASLSLGGTRRLRFRHVEDRTSVPVDLGHGDLLVMSGVTQRFWRHGIAKIRSSGARAPAPRLNLTYRQITPSRV